MKKIDFKGKRVIVMGLGLQGQGLWAAKLASQQGAKVTVTDLKSAKELASTLKKLKGLPIKYVLGKHREEDFAQADLIIRNPAVPTDSKYLQIAQANQVPIEMEISLFFLLSPARRENIIGVTGTRGKTTTTILIGKILSQAGFDTAVGGNIPEKPALSLLGRIKPETKVVLELSSWQLEGLSSHKISPHIAVITNIYPDHMNRYQSMTDYITAKKLIFDFQNSGDYLVLNKDNSQTRRLGKTAKSKVVYFSSSELPGSIASSIKLKGKHNLENLAAAVAVGRIMKIGSKTIQAAVKDFKGVPHRLEFVRKVDGVSFYNDTCATIPEATMAALSIFNQPVILIAGGADKNLDFSQLAQKIKDSTVKSVILLEGTAIAKLKKVIEGKLIGGCFNDFKKAILAAKKAAKPGDVVLLSPACASFGMFRNEFDRGEQFRRVVNAF